MSVESTAQAQQQLSLPWVDYRMKPPSRKEAGAYYTPDEVVSCLLAWAVRQPSDRLLDPSCGDGRFIAGHANSIGIEQDVDAARTAIERAPWALVHEGDFFAWASNTNERFECAAGNPPFIRYQNFKGPIRTRALAWCERLGAQFTGLTSSWAPFLVATASLLKPGGRLAFVVPAEIGHAPYSAPLLEYLVANFAIVHVVAIREKLFPELSEDCWLLFADGFGARTDEIRFSTVDQFASTPHPPHRFLAVSIREWRDAWGRRLRPFLLSPAARELYRATAEHPDSRRLGELATVGIGYVSGDNDFFHFRPSDARRWDIPDALLHPTVRNGRALPPNRLTAAIVDAWRRNDEPILLLRIPKTAELPVSVQNYLDTDAGKAARAGYKCRTRDPWYSVPDVRVPDFFLTYMSGRRPNLVRNEASCTCTNSVHGVRMREQRMANWLMDAWETPFVRLSCELEGHPLGGGMLKLEPREGAQIILPSSSVLRRMERTVIDEAIATMHEWRHYAAET
jgi:hypothetical protein